MGKPRKAGRVQGKERASSFALIEAKAHPTTFSRVEPIALGVALGSLLLLSFAWAVLRPLGLAVAAALMMFQAINKAGRAD
jgi:hypothetical protein